MTTKKVLPFEPPAGTIIYDPEEREQPWPKPNGNGHDEQPLDLPVEHDITSALCKREWSVPNLVAHRNVWLCSGEGAVGKSILLMQKDAAHVLGRDWIGTLPRVGPIIRIACEDEGDEENRRLQDICQHLDVTREALRDEGFHLYPFVGRDAVMFEADRRTERIRPTLVFEWLKREIERIRPVNVTIDTVADIFAGNEISRHHTRQTITLLRGLAREFDTTITLASHPSLHGIKSGSGLSGSTAWHNSVRARAYFCHTNDGEKEVNGDDAKTDLRMLRWHKNQYSRRGESVMLTYRNGVFVPGKVNPNERSERTAHLEKVFLVIFDRLSKRKINNQFSPYPSSTYAPAIFCKEPEAKEIKAKKDELAVALSNLIDSGKLNFRKEGPPSRERTILFRVDGAEPVSDLGEVMRDEPDDGHPF